ncbi:hypothetical protein [Chroococcidiopsis sp. CCNUC1]|nr:hypothetical protein [Chroococcidiopsis sp. CCNUC1]
MQKKYVIVRDGKNQNSAIAVIRQGIIAEKTTLGYNCPNSNF